MAGQWCRVPRVSVVLGARTRRQHMVLLGLANRAFVLAQTRLMSRRRTVSSIGRFLERGLDQSGSA